MDTGFLVADKRLLDIDQKTDAKKRREACTMKGLKEISEQMREGITQFIEAADGSKSLVDKAILDMKKTARCGKRSRRYSDRRGAAASTRLSRRYEYRGNMG